MPILLICVDGSATDQEVQACQAEYEVLKDRVWSYEPGFVDQLDDVPVYSPNDLPTLRTVGVCVSLPEPEETADEQALRRDVSSLLESMSALAARAGIEFSVEYREEQIGFLDGGASDGRVVTDFFGS